MKRVIKKSHRFNHEHCRLIILKVTSAYFKPSCLWSNIRVLCLIFAGVFFQIKWVWIFISSSIIWLETTVKTARYTNFDSANVLKRVIFPTVIRLRILHNLRLFKYLKLASRLFYCSEFLYYMKSKPIIIWSFL